MNFNRNNNDYIICVLNKDGTVYPLAWSEINPSKKVTRRVCLPYKNDDHYSDAVSVQAIRLYSNKRDYQKQLQRV